jgi:virginiamycin B lyase
MIPQMHKDNLQPEEQRPAFQRQKRKTWKGRRWLVALLILAILLSGLGGLTLNWYGQVSISKAGDPTRSGAVTEYSFPYHIGSMAAGVTLGPDGNVWFTNYRMGRIGKITPQGEMTEYALPSGSGPTFPDSSAQLIATGSDGNLWYAAQSYPAQGKIVKFSPHGTILGEYPFPVNGMAAGIVAGPDGNVWYGIADSIVRLTPTGKATTFRVSENQPAVWSLAAGPDGNVWFSLFFDIPNSQEKDTHIGFITPTGTIRIFSYQMPWEINGLTKGPDGNVWFTGQDRIGRISPSGEVKFFSSSIPIDSMGGVITLGPDGNLWYASANKMARITPAGKQTVFSLPHGDVGQVVSMTAGADGGVWYIYSLFALNPFDGVWGTRIARITP